MILDLRNPPTARLLKLLRACYDDGNPPLLVSPMGLTAVSVLRQDGSDPSVSEQAHARGCVAAHNIEPL